MRIAFRVDASSEIGTGHFMRCLTLALALKKRGVQIRFVSRHLPEYLRQMLSTKGFEFALLNSVQDETALKELAHAHWLGVSQALDATDSINALSTETGTWDWLIVDHYALDTRWESMLRQSARNILAIDDIADRQHDCDILLDQNLYADMETRYTGKVPRLCQMLLGPRYAILRDEFRELHEQVRLRTGPVSRALIFFGGVDSVNYTGLAIEALAEIGMPDLHVDVVIGAQHPDRERIEADCAQRGYICHVQTDKMAELMMTADLAIGAGGSTAWERCCLGLPTLTICVANNQRKQIADAASEGLMYAPELKGEFVPAIRRQVSALIDNCYLRQAICRNGMRAVDGRGVLRVIGALGCSDIEIRVARQDDAEKLFEWRNHPTVRTASRKPDTINREDHQEWLSSVLASSDRLLLIGQREGFLIGVVRFDIQGDEAEVSIYLAPYINQQGQGRELLQSAEYWFATNRPKINKVNALVLGGNERSQRLFFGAGYQIESTKYSKRLH